ncbi:MAG: DUF58 domain-containing protein [Planctomycetota bacterium]
MPVAADPAAGLWRLSWPRQPASGQAGTRLGRAAGASLEFLDTRDYVVGDDLRHVDWRAYARTDQLRVRLFREEVAPALDVVLDTSASMAVTAAKAAATDALRAAFVFWGERGGARPRVYETPDLAPRTPLRRDGVRVVLSDFLRPDDPQPTITRLATGAALLVVVQVLDPWELAPTADGALALVDCESSQRVELVLDEAAVARYRERLARLCAGLVTATRRVGGRCATLAAAPLAEMCRGGLLPAAIVEAA